MKELEDLLDEWQQKYAGKEFVRDGIINLSEWERAPRKIAFLLKDVNGKEGSYGRIHLPKCNWDFRTMGNKEPWPELGRWAYCLIKGDMDPPPQIEEAKDMYKYAFRSVAVVNIKKVAGTSRIANSVLKKYGIDDKELLRKQISLINPDTVVCCGSGFMFWLAQQIFPDAANAEKVAERYIKITGACYKGDKRLWMDFIHPSAPFVRSDSKYYSLLALFRKAIAKPF